MEGEDKRHLKCKVKIKYFKSVVNTYRTVRNNITIIAVYCVYNDYIVQVNLPITFLPKVVVGNINIIVFIIFNLRD